MLSKLDECIEYVSSHVSQTLATVFQYSRSHLHYPHISCFQPHFKDYPVYLSKFKQCLSRAMLLIRSHAVSTLQNLTAQLSRRVRVISAQPMIRSQMIVWFLLCLLMWPEQDPLGAPNADNAFTLYYVKFRAAAPKVRVRLLRHQTGSSIIQQFNNIKWYTHYNIYCNIEFCDIYIYIYFF